MIFLAKLPENIADIFYREERSDKKRLGNPFREAIKLHE
jgi:hypothetical protein